MQRSGSSEYFWFFNSFYFHQVESERLVLTSMSIQGHAVLKEQLQTVVRDNHILKRAVSIQHERQAEHENCSQEINQLKQLISQYQEQVRTLEVMSIGLNFWFLWC